MMNDTLPVQAQNHTTVKRTFWTLAIFYMLTAFEFFYMASPFAAYRHQDRLSNHQPA